MASAEKIEHRNRDIEDESEDRDDTPLPPIAHWSVSNHNPFSFWFTSSALERAVKTPDEYEALDVNFKGYCIFGENFCDDDAVYHYMHHCIRRRMIWNPKIDITDQNGKYTSEFVNYMHNWLFTMYLCMYQFKSMMMKKENQEQSIAILQAMEDVARAKLNYLHTGIVPPHQKLVQWPQAGFTPSKQKRKAFIIEQDRKSPEEMVASLIEKISLVNKQLNDNEECTDEKSYEV